LVVFKSPIKPQPVAELEKRLPEFWLRYLQLLGMAKAAPSLSKTEILHQQAF